MADSVKSSSSRIAFTLPLSCQICLGKVKLPVVCPNQHVFCSPCMDVWLQRNQQCPSCRVPITDDNPCKKILGGLSQQDEEETSFSKSKELRRSRLDLLCKDYEDEIERLQMENDSLQQENHLLEEQVKSYASQKLKDAEDDVAKGKASSSSTSPQPDMNMLMMLTKKLQDATGLYERVKKDMDKLKQENSNVKDENAALTRENQRVRSELVGRSPRKFGRFTVATLETKLEKQEKEVTQLQKALERSDAYIEEVEKELESYRKKIQGQNTCIRCKCTLQVERAKESDGLERDRINDHVCQKKGKSASTSVEVSKAESSSNNALLHRGRSLDRVDDSNKVRGDGSQPSTSKDDWRKLQDDISKTTQSDWKLSSNGVAEEKKDSLTVGNFYGKRPLMKQHKSKSSHGSETVKRHDDSFELEMPSPTSSSVVSSSEAVRRIRFDNQHADAVSTSDLRNLTPNDSTIDLGPNDTLASASSVESCKKRLRYESDASDVSGLSFLNSPKKGSGGKKTAAAGSGKQVTFNNNVAVKNMIKKRNAHSDSVLDITLPSDTSEVDILNDIKPSRNQNMFADESYDANMSMNSDIMDCMELFSGAEKRLGQVKKSDNKEEQTGQKGKEQGNSGQQGYGPPPPAAGEFLHTYPPPSQPNRNYGLPGGLDYMGASSGSHTQGGRSVSSSASSSSTLSSNSRSALDNVSSSIDPYKSYISSTKPYSDQNHTNKGSDITSSRLPEHPKSKDHNLKSSSLTNFPSYQLPTTQGHTNAGSGGLVGGLSNFAAGALGGNSGIPPSLCTDSLMTKPYPPRPASTSTLQGMIHTLNSLDEESSSRPSSTPGAQSSTASSNNWRNTYPSSTGISSSSDFRPSSSLSSMPPASHSAYPGFSLSQGSTGGLPGGMGGTGGLGAGLSGSQSSINGLPGYPGMSAGVPPMLPGMGGLSQPTSRYGNDFGAGLFSLGGSSSGMMPGFSGGMTQ